jgi:signal transduction histidine kinase
MTGPEMPNSENSAELIESAEKAHRSVLNTIETMLAFGDFQKQVDGMIDPQELIALITERINEIVNFDASAIYFVNQETSDVKLLSCVPSAFQTEMEDQFEVLIEHGYVAWALKERRGIAFYSNDARYRVVLHAVATYSRIRGIFVGLQAAASGKTANTPPHVLTLVLRNAANALESLEYIKTFKQRNAELRTIVDELRWRDSQLSNARRMDAIAALTGNVGQKFQHALLGLSGDLDLLKPGVADHPDQKRLIGQMVAIIKKMTGLNQRLLAYARGGRYKTQKVPVNEMAKKVLEGLQPYIEEDVNLVFNPNSVPCYVCVDVTQLQMSIAGIVANAMEAVDRGGRICIDIESASIRNGDFPSELMPGDYVLLQIRDNGRGMDLATKSRIFEPFFSTNAHGRGLSLAAVYEILKSYNGSVQVESEPGHGTTVRLYVPKAD